MQLTEELARLFSLLSRLTNEHQRGAELNRLEFLILSRLQRDGATRPADLAVSEGLDPSTLSRRIASMAERNLVAREADAADRRSHRLSVTGAGQAALRAEQRRRVRLVADAVGHWSEPNRAELARLLHDLNDSLQNRTLS